MMFVVLSLYMSLGFSLLRKATCLTTGFTDPNRRDQQVCMLDCYVSKGAPPYLMFCARLLSYGHVHSIYTYYTSFTCSFLLCRVRNKLEQQSLSLYTHLMLPTNREV